MTPDQEIFGRFEAAMRALRGRAALAVMGAMWDFLRETPEGDDADKIRAILSEMEDEVAELEPAVYLRAARQSREKQRRLDLGKPCDRYSFAAMACFQVAMQRLARGEGDWHTIMAECFEQQRHMAGLLGVRW